MNDLSSNSSPLKALFTRFLKTSTSDTDRTPDSLQQEANPLPPPPAVKAILAVPRATYDAMSEEIGAEAVEEIAKVFVRDTETRLTMFETVAIDDAREVIQREAHSLKSAAGTFGLSELADAARELEKSALILDPANYHLLVARLRALFTSARTDSADATFVLLPTE